MKNFRGAVAAVTVANRVRHGSCGRPLPAAVMFVGLIDPVRTLVSHLDGSLTPGVPRTIQIIKAQYFSLSPERLVLRTHLIGNIPASVIDGIEHANMNCIKDISRPVQARLLFEAEQAGFSFGPLVVTGDKCIAGPGSTRRLVEVRYPEPLPQ